MDWSLEKRFFRFQQLLDFETTFEQLCVDLSYKKITETSINFWKKY